MIKDSRGMDADTGQIVPHPAVSSSLGGDKGEVDHIHKFLVFAIVDRRYDMFMMSLSRRQLLKSGMACSMGFIGLRSLMGHSNSATAATARREIEGFGPLVRDQHGRLDLPADFSYTMISSSGALMDDGLLVPGLPDGMGSFLDEKTGHTILVRNHEIQSDWKKYSPFDRRNTLMRTEHLQYLYDRGKPGQPHLGGTTTLVFDTKAQRLRKHFLSLTGTLLNCAGGPTPWNSWITCEESEKTVDDEHQKDHGYNFEVPATTEMKLHRPQPLRAMGRFKHEAVAVDPRTGIIYQTEDQHEGLFYRFIPNKAGQLLEGGRLQVLCIRDQPSADTRNWPLEDEYDQIEPRHARSPVIEVGQSLATEWIDVQDVEAKNSPIRFAEFGNGAARFARGEGIWFADDCVYVACTNGGPKKIGQIWKYTPSPAEGRPNESEQPGILELFVESSDHELLENCDNLTNAPWGDLMVCEDSAGTDRILGITPEGDIYTLAHNSQDDAELAGICFSRDGSTLFVNKQQKGETYAITGPWERGVKT